MKLTHLIPFSLLSMAIAENEAFTQSFAGDSRAVTHHDHPRPDQRRQLRIIPTLLGKILDIRARFDFFGGLLADILFGQAPSEAPSMTPSDFPTTAPSDAPVVAPSRAPSAAPFTWQDFLGDKTHGFETCSYDPKPIDFSTSTELTVMYSYQMELQSSAQVYNVTAKIEALLQERLIEQVCVTSTDTLGITSDPADRLGGICPTGNGTCYVVAGRLTLLVGRSVIADASDVYCEFLETIRDYLSGGEVRQRVGGVATINSTILESLAPTFCTIRVWKDGVVNLELGDGTTSERRHDSASPTTVIPIVLSLVACTVAIAVMFLYQRHRRAVLDTECISGTHSRSDDLNFEHSDESMSRPQSAMPEEPQDSTAHTKSAIATSTNPTAASEPVLFSPANFAPPILFSPTHTEQEIIFSPSSTVASSVLFRSP